MEKYRVNRNGTRMHIHQVGGHVGIVSEVGLRHLEPQDLHLKIQCSRISAERQAAKPTQGRRVVTGKAAELKTSLDIFFSTFRSIREESQMDMFTNTVSLWRSILGGISKRARVFITKTASRMITVYQTLSLCNTESIKVVLNAHIVERSF